MEYKAEKTHPVWMCDMSVHGIPWRDGDIVYVPYGLCC